MIYKEMSKKKKVNKEGRSSKNPNDNNMNNSGRNEKVESDTF